MTQSELRDELHRAVRASEVGRVRTMLGRGVDADAVVGDGGRTPLMEARDAATVDLLIRNGAAVDARDADGCTPLIHAAREGRVDVVRALIAAGASLDLESRRYGKPALVEAVERDHAASAALLRAAGARDDRVTEGAAVTEDHEAWAACVAYIRAVHDADPARLQQLSSAGRPVTFEGVDWDGWRGRRPTRPVLAWGFVRGDDATIALTGRGVRDLPVGWEFQLRREAGGWKVLRERSLRVDGR